MKGAFEVLQNRCLNKLLKIALKQFASNVTEAAAQQIAKSLSTIEDILLMVDVDCNLKHRSGYHNSKHLEEIVLTITNDLHEKPIVSLFVSFSSVFWKAVNFARIYAGATAAAAARLVELAFCVVFLTHKLYTS